MVETEFTLVRTGGNQEASDKLYGGGAEGYVDYPVL